MENNALWAPCGSHSISAIPQFIQQLRYINFGPSPLTAEGRGQGGVGEVFVAGSNDGKIAVYDVSEESTRVALKPHDDAVLALSAPIGCLIASGSADGTAAVFDLSHPNVRTVVKGLTHPQAVHSVLLWEGREEWRMVEGEETVVYLFTGCADGLVRLWRVDIASCSGYLHAVLGAAGKQAADAEPVAGHPVWPMALDGNDRLLSGADRFVRVHSLAPRGSGSGTYGVPKPRPPATQPAPGASPEIKRVYSENSSDEIRPWEWLNCRVWAREEALLEEELRTTCTAQDHLREAHKNERGGGHKVAEEDEPSKFKPKHRTVLAGAEVGTCVNLSNEELLRAGGGTVAVTFTSLKNTVRWPPGALGPVLPPMLTAATKEGQIRSLCQLGPGRIVSGSELGCIQVWQWLEEHQKYTILFTADRGHQDIVKEVWPLRGPDIFLSCSCDGTVKEWHVLDDPSLLQCRTSIPLGDAMVGGVACMEVIPPIAAVFAVPTYHNVVHGHILLPVATCALPPGWVYDGTRSVRIEDLQKLAAEQQQSES